MISSIFQDILLLFAIFLERVVEKSRTKRKKETEYRVKDEETQLMSHYGTDCTRTCIVSQQVSLQKEFPESRRHDGNQR